MPARSDNFNRADNASVVGVASDGLSGWVAGFGTWGIAGNALYNSNAASNAVLTLESTDVTAGSVQLTQTVAGNFGGLVARYTDGNNYFNLRSNSGGGWVFQRRQGGSWTSLGTLAGTNAAGDVLRIEFSGSTVRAFANGVQVGSDDTTGLNTTATRHGVYASGDSTSRFDDFSITSSSDTTAPTLSSPTGTGGLGVCSGSVSTNEGNGTLYAVATASATAPSAAQVKAGQDHTGTAALRVVSQAVSATGTQTIASGAISGGAGTRYLHYMHEDAASNQSAVVSSASFEVTAAATTLAVSVPDAAGVTGVNGVVLSAAAPGAGVSVIATVAGGSFNGSGLLNIDITGLGVTVGALRYVVLSKSDGTTGQSPAPFCAQGPVVAS